MGFRFCVFGLLVSLAVVSSGCQRGPKGVVRDKVSKVTGTLLIDGEAQESVAIRLIRIGEENPNAGTSKALTSSALTDKDGNFSIGTYENGPDADGAPVGEYALVFQWGQINLMGGGNYGGDKFKGKYADPAKSEFKVTVGDKPVDLGTIELSTKK